MSRNRLRWPAACNLLPARQLCDVTTAERTRIAEARFQNVTTVAIFLVTVSLICGCQRAIRPRLPVRQQPAQIAELWIKPDANRDLFWGIGGKRLAPDPSRALHGHRNQAHVATVAAIRSRSRRRQREWTVKFPPEASTEVVASRLFWGVGYHQPPIYYLAEWHAESATFGQSPAPGAISREIPDLIGLKSDTFWSYYENPFVGTKQLNGMLVMHAMLGNSDLKDDQNAFYTLEKPVEGASRWYVARDLGQTFGRTGLLDPPRGDVEVFEQTPFIRGVANGRSSSSTTAVTKRSSRTSRRPTSDGSATASRACRIVSSHDAFRAGGYPKSLADRFIRRLKQKIAEGRALKD